MKTNKEILLEVLDTCIDVEISDTNITLSFDTLNLGKIEYFFYIDDIEDDIDINEMRTSTEDGFFLGEDVVSSINNSTGILLLNSLRDREDEYLMLNNIEDALKDAKKSYETSEDSFFGFVHEFDYNLECALRENYTFKFNTSDGEYFYYNILELRDKDNLDDEFIEYINTTFGGYNEMMLALEVNGEEYKE